MMFHEDPLIILGSEIIYRVFEVGLHIYWITFTWYHHRLLYWKIAIVHQLDGYYSFNLYHMQPAL